MDVGVDPALSRLAWGANETLRLLGQATAVDRPFFIRWDTPEPHLPNIVPEPYHALYPPGDIPPWPSFPDPLVGKPYMQGQQRRTWDVEGWTWEQWAPVVSRYLGQISLLDAQVGRLLEALEALGLADNTLVIYTTDHGDLCGGHGMVDKHYVMYEDVVHVPLIVRWPGVTQPGTVSDAMVTHALDLASTICEATGLEVPEAYQGRSLLPLLHRELPAAWPTEVLSTYDGAQFVLYVERMLRDRRFKYVWNPTDVDELYDLEADPWELCNIVAQPDSQVTLSAMRTRLLNLLTEQGDEIVAKPWLRNQLASGRKLGPR